MPPQVSYVRRVETIDWTAREFECNRPLEIDLQLFDSLCVQGAQLCRWLRYLGQPFDGIGWVRAALLAGSGEQAEAVQDDPRLAFAIADAIDLRLAA